MKSLNEIIKNNEKRRDEFFTMVNTSAAAKMSWKAFQQLNANQRAEAVNAQMLKGDLRN